MNSHQQLGIPTTLPRGNRGARRSLVPQSDFHLKGTIMFAKILGAIAGEKLAGRNNKAAGALLGAAVPVIARRGLGPLGFALAAGYCAKKLIDYSRGRKAAESRRRNSRAV